jgi:tripartite-type tricarboxylate transporter receptor subunit TctC
MRAGLRLLAVRRNREDWMGKRNVLAGAIAMLGMVSAMSAWSAPRPFYAGKQLTVLVNFAAGGPTDIEGRVFAEFLANHIDGHPSVIVENKEGAGGLTGTVYLGEVGPKDGTEVGYLTGSAWNAVNQPNLLPTPFKDYDFIGYQSGTTVYYARSDTPPGLKTATDIVKVNGMVVGGQSVDNVKDLLHRLTLDMLGVRYKYVTGYQSSSAARLALQRGEIQFYSEGAPSYLSVIQPQFVKTGIVTPIYYDPQYDGQHFKISDSVVSLPILPFQELYKKLKGSAPSGPLWQAYLGVLAVNQTAQRLIALPPRSPKPAVDALRKAVHDLDTDRAFQAAALKAFGFVPFYQTGPDTNAQVGAMLASIQPSTLSFIQAYVKKAKQ